MNAEQIEVIERLTLVDRFDTCGEVWLLLHPKGSILKGDFVHGTGTIRVEGEFARALSTYFKEREAAIASGVVASDDDFKTAVLRCRYPVCKTIHPSGWGWDTSRLNEVIADHGGETT